MAEFATIARPYANAVFDLAKADNALDEWSRRLGVLAATAKDETVVVMLVFLHLGHLPAMQLCSSVSLRFHLWKPPRNTELSRAAEFCYRVFKLRS